ncbi:MAG: tetrahydrofolate dehydrogenase/cyclohydrolase catalytic domain-containing protein, partial [Candidatus Curtissbacteria bacterium]
MAKLLDGKVVRDQIAEDLKTQIQNLMPAPRLVIIQVGDNPQSNTYIAQKIKFGEKIGTNVKHLQLPEDVSEKTLNFQISNFNKEKSINGIIIQLPIPGKLNKDEIIEAINPAKDVDGLHS